MEQNQSTMESLGQFHTFGKDGVAYEVLEDVDHETVRIRVLETGETLAYSRHNVAIDPVA